MTVQQMKRFFPLWIRSISRSNVCMRKDARELCVSPGWL